MSTMSEPQRALQAWSVLALAAITRTILTYEELASLTGLPNNSAHVLYYVYCYCKQRNLPLLSILAVNKHSGKPEARDLYADVEIPAEQRRCFEYDWLGQGVPKLDELIDARECARAASA